MRRCCAAVTLLCVYAVLLRLAICRWTSAAVECSFFLKCVLSFVFPTDPTVCFSLFPFLNLFLLSCLIFYTHRVPAQSEHIITYDILHWILLAVCRTAGAAAAAA